MLTLTPISELNHVVKASDNRLYDAFSLHTWVNTQESDKKFVIPGQCIDSISGYTWGWFVIQLLCKYFSKMLNFIRSYYSQPERNTQTTGTQTNIPLQKEYLRENTNTIRKCKPLQISPYSAFSYVAPLK